MGHRDDPLRAAAEAQIAAAGRRTSADRDRLAKMLRTWCWPGGPEDRTEPAARAWVRRWGPSRLGAIDLECTCAEGRCTLCN
jgi:hypothetical protein